MLPLGNRQPPANTEELVAALTQGLSHLFHLPPGRAVVAVEGEYPSFGKIHFNLTDAEPNTMTSEEKLLARRRPVESC